ncbi:MAG: helix-turn-helix transcriptional regulator [Betaproteobacteria bacterium]|nr:helix-turn-helix transcriptional regulator [Betaproteobacteria bacterium]
MQRMKNAHRLLTDLLLAGLTQAEIGRRIGVHHSQISRWISGNPPRHADAILRLASEHGKVCK